jgi:hypothetical protein
MKKRYAKPPVKAAENMIPIIAPQTPLTKTSGTPNAMEVIPPAREEQNKNLGRSRALKAAPVTLVILCAIGIRATRNNGQDAYAVYLSAYKT